MPRSGTGRRRTALVGISLALGVLLVLPWAPGATSAGGPGAPSDVSARPLDQITTTETTTAFWNNSSADDQFSIGLQPSSTLGTIGLTLDFSVLLNATGGSLDVNTSRTGEVSTAVPANASLDLDVLGVSRNVSIPPLIGSAVNVSIPGLYYTVPVIGVQLGINLTMSGSLTGRSTIAGNATGGAGEISWNRSASTSLRVAADATPGSIRSILSAVRYNWSVGLAAAGCLPLLGCVSYPLLPYVSLGGFAGSIDGVNATYRSVPDLRIASVSATPTDPSPGDNLTFATDEVGGAGEVQLQYAGLPAGCSAMGASTVDCPTVSNGTYEVNVSATDQEGQHASGTTSVQVSAPSAPPGTPVTSSAPGGTPLLYWVLLPVAVVAAIVGTVLVMRRRPPGTPGIG